MSDDSFENIERIAVNLLDKMEKTRKEHNTKSLSGKVASRQRLGGYKTAGKRINKINHHKPPRTVIVVRQRYLM